MITRGSYNSSDHEVSNDFILRFLNVFITYEHCQACSAFFTLTFLKRFWTLLTFKTFCQSMCVCVCVCMLRAMKEKEEKAVNLKRLWDEQQHTRNDFKSWSEDALAMLQTTDFFLLSQLDLTHIYANWSECCNFKFKLKGWVLNSWRIFAQQTVYLKFLLYVAMKEQ